jgi:hypothetical protein
MDRDDALVERDRTLPRAARDPFTAADDCRMTVNTLGARSGKAAPRDGPEPTRELASTGAFSRGTQTIAGKPEGTALECSRCAATLEELAGHPIGDRIDTATVLAECGLQPQPTGGFLCEECRWPMEHEPDTYPGEQSQSP